MAKYKCPTLGDCDRANAGEIFERAPGDDLKCPQCEMLLVAEQGSATVASNRKGSLIAAAAAVVLLAAGGGAYIYKKPALSAPVAEEIVIEKPTVAVAQSSGPAPVPVAAAIEVSKPGGAIAPSDAETTALRKEGDIKLVKGDTQGAEAAGNKAAANEMVKLAISKMAQGKLDEADKELADAKLRDPTNSLVYYNAGLLRMKQVRMEDALKEFEASFIAGFSYYDQMDRDPDLNILRGDKRFAELVAKYRTSTK